MFRRRQAKTQGRLMREEFGESFEHFRMAVGHAAGGAATLVAPKVDSAKRSIRPGLRKSARKGKATLMREEPRMRRWPMVLGGLLAAGAVVGAASAIISRRRANRDQWEEYGSTRSTSGRTDALIESAKSTVDTGREKVQSLAESAKERAADMRSPSTSTSSTSSARPSPSSPEFGSREDLYGKAGTSPNNSRS
jgi:hypothetical protein